MKRKQFIILVLALLVLGGAGIVVFRQDIAAYRASGAKIGAQLLPKFKLAEVAQVKLRDAKSQTTLVRKETGWVVRERGDYPANFADISDLMVKLVELKVTQSEQVGASLLPRLELNEPGKIGDTAQPRLRRRRTAGPRPVWTPRRVGWRRTRHLRRMFPCSTSP